MFCGRSSEISALDECYKKNRNTMCVMYGRVGIGKTEIAKTYTYKKKCFYYNALMLSPKEQFLVFRQQICDFTSSNAALKYEMEDMVSLLKFLCSVHNNSDEKLNIVIDEFQNIVKSFDHFISDLVKLTKTPELNNKLNIILLSSSVKWVEGDMAQDIGPAALAFTKIIKVKEFGILDILALKKDSDINTCIKMYSVFGGVPRYLRMINESISFDDNVLRLALSKNSIFYDETTKLLKNDLRELTQYNSILCTIAQGSNKLNEIHERTGFSRPKISVYLKNLIDIDIVEKYYSIDIGDYVETQKGLYRIKDNFINFWYKCIFPFKSSLEFDDIISVYKNNISKRLEKIYEDNYVKICDEYLHLLMQYNKLNFKATKSGAWYGKNSIIDICMTDSDNKVLVGKCKWSGIFSKLDLDFLINDLKDAKIDPSLIVLFSTDGFSRELQEIANKTTKIMLIDNSQF